jgi:hypothetical protein
VGEGYSTSLLVRLLSSPIVTFTVRVKVWVKVRVKVRAKVRDKVRVRVYKVNKIYNKYNTYDVMHMIYTTLPLAVTGGLHFPILSSLFPSLLSSLSSSFNSSLFSINAC